MNKSSYCLHFTVPSDTYDFVLVKCIELGMLGCEELSSAEGLQVKVYFKNELSAQQALKKLNETGQSKNILLEEVEAQDWNAKWRESMKPAGLAPGWWVSPLWLPPPTPAKHWIKIEPKMAFGTGHHETTRLAAKAIIARKRRIKNKRVLDIGTGSGVLCFVAGLCGTHFCLGVEIDPHCRENLAENFRANPTAGKIGFVIGSIDGLNGHGLVDLVVMNMILTEASPLLDMVAALLKPGGSLIWSGILIDEFQKAVSLAKESGLAFTSEKRENEWWCGTFRTIKR
jgi:ribosomal protein L11 methyltransferase